jgi:hypothetical protein
MESLHKAIVQDYTYRFIVDDVSEGRKEEYRCSIYDTDNDLELIGEGWGSSPTEATLQAMEVI